MKCFKVIIEHPEDEGQMGVYKITIGKKYYIGSTVDTSQRKESWEKAVDDCFHNIEGRVGNNSATKIMLLAIKRKKHCVGIMEVLELVDSEDLLNIVEQEWLKKSKGDENCLNVKFKVSNAPRRKTIKEQEVNS